MTDFIYARIKACTEKAEASLLSDKRKRVIAKAVCALILHLLFACYNGILGFLSSSLLFCASCVYYFMLCLMRFAAVLLARKGERRHDRISAGIVGVMLMMLSVVFSMIVIMGIQSHTATPYGEITMITIATFTFAKIIAAIITAVRHARTHSDLYKTVNAIRYSEVAVSLLTMQQSMLVSFSGASQSGIVILNGCTGGAVCILILALGITTWKRSRKEATATQK